MTDENVSVIFAFLAGIFLANAGWVWPTVAEHGGRINTAVVILFPMLAALLLCFVFILQIKEPPK